MGHSHGSHRVFIATAHEQVDDPTEHTYCTELTVNVFNLNA